MNRPRHPFSEPSFEELSSYLDGELPPDRLDEIDRWLVDHPDAIGKLQKIRKVETALRKAVKPVARRAAAAKTDARDPCLKR